MTEQYIEADTTAEQQAAQDWRQYLGSLSLADMNSILSNYAYCRSTDPSLFYAQDTASITRAKAACSQCVVREICLEVALEQKETFGVWGGMTPEERRLKLKHRIIPIDK